MYEREQAWDEVHAALVPRWQVARPSVGRTALALKSNGLDELLKLLAVGACCRRHVAGIDNQPDTVDIEDAEPVDLARTLMVAVSRPASARPALEETLAAAGVTSDESVLLVPFDVRRDAPLDVLAGVPAESHVDRLGGVAQRDVNDRFNQVIDRRSRIEQRAPPLAWMPIEHGHVPEHHPEEAVAVRVVAVYEPAPEVPEAFRHGD